MLSAVQRCDRLISGLLTISRSESSALHMVEVDLGDIVGSSLDRFASMATLYGVRIMEPELERTRICGDPVLLARCIDNLLENAIVYNQKSGTVFVRTALLNDRVRLIVGNSGPDLAPAVISALFAPYRRGDFMQLGGVQGNGLGLAIVRSIVQAHGGSINAKPGSNGGLLVEIILPRAQSFTETIHPDRYSEATGQSGRIYSER